MEKIGWIDPLTLAESFNNICSEGDEWIFLHSSLVKKGFSRYSVLAFDKSFFIKGNNIVQLKKNS